MHPELFERRNEKEKLDVSIHKVSSCVSVKESESQTVKLLQHRGVM